MTQKYQPANGTEGGYFMGRYCERCKKYGYTDEYPEDACKILVNTMAFNPSDPEYPKEWIYKNDIPTCTAFEEVEQ